MPWQHTAEFTESNVTLQSVAQNLLTKEDAAQVAMQAKYLSGALHVRQHATQLKLLCVHILPMDD